MARFTFEEETWATLEFMPFALRYRLDRAGVKLPLAAWQKLPHDERVALCEHPVGSLEQRDALRARCLAHGEHTGAPAKAVDPSPDPPPWRSDDAYSRVAARSLALGPTPSRARWEALSEEQAYVLWRLADPTKDEARFTAAAREFGIA